MTQDYAKVDAYLNGYRAAINAAFCPETGWFWDVLGQTHSNLCAGLTPELEAGADELYDALVEAVNEKLGR